MEKDKTLEELLNDKGITLTNRKGLFGRRMLVDDNGLDIGFYDHNEAWLNFFNKTFK